MANNINWGEIYCYSHWGDDKNKASVPEFPEFCATEQGLCGTQYSYTGGENFPSLLNINLGAGTGTVTLNFNAKTRLSSDYGNLRLTLQNAVYPAIVQLVSPKGDVIDEKYTTKSEPLDFIDIAAAKYLVRVIYDENNNKKYDTGNYLKKIQPERVSYYPTLLDIRSGWDYVETFILK